MTLRLCHSDVNIVFDAMSIDTLDSRSTHATVAPRVRMEVLLMVVFGVVNVASEASLISVVISPFPFFANSSPYFC